MTKIANIDKGNSRAISNGSLTHMRYSHGACVSDIHVVCHHCGGRAAGHVGLIDLDGQEVDASVFSTFTRPTKWKIRCESCGRDKMVSGFYENVGEFYYKIPDLNFWSYNLAHLKAICAHLRGQLKENDEYYFVVEAYTHGAWKKNRDKLLKKIEKKFINGEWVS